MFSIVQFSAPPGFASIIYGGLSGQMATRSPGERLGPQGAVYYASVPGFGFIKLEDIGQVGNGYGVKVNDDSTWTYAGEGAMTVIVAPDGSASIEGGNGTVTTDVQLMPTDCDIEMGTAIGFGYYVLGPTAGTRKKITVPPGTQSFVVSVAHPTFRGASPYGDLVLTAPDGTTIDRNTPTGSGVVTQVATGGLVFARVSSPGEGTWTASVTAPAGMPWYLMASAQAASDTQAAWSEYASLSEDDQATLATLGLIVPPDASSLALASPEDLDAWFVCALCKAQWYVCVAALAIFQPEIAVIGLIPAAAAQTIVAITADILDLDAGTARNVLDALAKVLDPLAWPAAICGVVQLC